MESVNCHIPPVWIPTHGLLVEYLLCLAAILALPTTPVRGAELAQTIERIKPSVVGVGIFLKTRSPSVLFVGTGLRSPTAGM